MQSWLFFGLIHETFGMLDIPVVEADFIREDGGQQFVTTVALPAYLDRFYARGKERQGRVGGDVMILAA
jgi:hypothetical protein